VHAPAPIVFDVARHFNLQSVPLIRTIFGLRARILGAGSAWDQNSLTPDDLLRMGWATLAEEPGHLFIAGAACQPWQADVVFTPIGPERFRLYVEPNRVKVAWTLEAQSLGSELTRLATETRAVGTDAVARSRFRRPADPRTQPTGWWGVEFLAGGAMLECAKDRRFVRARARSPAADAPVVGPQAGGRVEGNFTRAERRTLRQPASEAHARELDEALRDLASAFTDWKAQRIDGFTLAQTIHEFHDGIARDLWARYGPVSSEVAVWMALEAGVIRPGEVPTELRAKVGMRPER
jgi:hypothetical protein